MARAACGQSVRDASVLPPESSGVDVERSSAVTQPRADLLEELERVAAHIRDSGLLIRVTGGLGIHYWCQCSSREPFQREYADLDLAVGRRVKPSAVDTFMVELGYTPDAEFNALHGEQQLYYVDVANGRHVDVFVEYLRMCHAVRLGHRLVLTDVAVSPSDLLLTKLQIVELNDKDVRDVLALLCAKRLVGGSPTELDVDYLGKVWGSGWPLWRTCLGSLARAAEELGRIRDDGERERVGEQIERLRGLMRDCPKTAKWKARAIIGERLRWYDLPEEVAR